MSDFLVGRKINGMKIADDQKAILFICEDGSHIVKTDGDCCSDTWVENIELPLKGFPATVLSVEDLELPDQENEDEYGDVIAFYGCKISTDNGDIVIDYRNESNGYYGGNLSWPDHRYFYGGVYGQNISTENWIEIKDASTGG